MRGLIALLLSTAAGVQCHSLAPDGAMDRQHDIAIERVPAAAVVTKVEDDLEQAARTDPLALLHHCQERCRAQYRDYTCTFTKQERLGEAVTAEQETVVQFRQEPYSVRMRWVRNPSDAADVVYVAGRWKDSQGHDQAWCEPAGPIARIFVKKVLQPINGPRAARNSRRTIDQFGFDSTLDLIIKYCEKARDAGALDLRYVGQGSVDGRATLVFERRLPYTGAEQPYPDRLLVFHIDREWLVPTACFSYSDDRGEELLGKYILTGVEFNVGLDDDDFGPQVLDM